MTGEVTPPVEPTPDEPSTPAVETPVSDDNTGAPADPPAAPAEPVSDPDENEDPAPQGGRRSRAQERIEELAQTNRYLREHNEFLREAIAKGLRPAEAPPAPTPLAQEPENDEPPTLESVDFDAAKFAKANAEWLRREVKRGVAQALSSEKSQVAEQTQEAAIVEAAAEFRKDHPDFDVVLANPKLQFTPTVFEALKEAGAESPALGYHLATNPDKLAKIARLAPKQQLLALGRIQAELAVAKAAAPKPSATPAPTPPKAPAAPAAKKPATTNAPPPPTPLPTGTSKPDIDPLKLSGTEWAKLRRQELAEKRAGGPRTVRSF